MSAFVKICGVTTLDDALACAEAGADAIGFNFWPKSKRYLPIERAAAIAKELPSSIHTVGVFVDPEAAQVERALGEGIHIAQLHGDESPAFCQQFAGRYWKALRLRDAATLERLHDYACELLLLDADTPQYGGSGQRADVALARRAAESHPILLAGGLTPDNVADAVRAVRPVGVDVAGGVERAPGIKDHEKVAAFVARAKGA